MKVWRSCLGLFSKLLPQRDFFLRKLAVLYEQMHIFLLELFMIYCESNFILQTLVSCLMVHILPWRFGQGSILLVDQGRNIHSTEEE
jgi:hypothetical protein